MVFKIKIFAKSALLRSYGVIYSLYRMQLDPQQEVLTDSTQNTYNRFKKAIFYYVDLLTKILASFGYAAESPPFCFTWTIMCIEHYLKTQKE